MMVLTLILSYLMSTCLVHGDVAVQCDSVSPCPEKDSSLCRDYPCPEEPESELSLEKRSALYSANKRIKQLLDNFRGQTLRVQPTRPRRLRGIEFLGKRAEMWEPWRNKRSIEFLGKRADEFADDQDSHSNRWEELRWPFQRIVRGRPLYRELLGKRSHYRKHDVGQANQDMIF